MHDLIQEMGKEIVRQQSLTDPGKRSRLWLHEDIFDVLTKNSVRENLKLIRLSTNQELSSFLFYFCYFVYSACFLRNNFLGL